jgi:hypothetical protein
MLPPVGCGGWHVVVVVVLVPLDPAELRQASVGTMYVGLKDTF